MEWFKRLRNMAQAKPVHNAARMPFVRLTVDANGKPVALKIPFYMSSWASGPDTMTVDECCDAMEDASNAGLAVAKMYHPMVARSDFDPVAYAMLCSAHLKLHAAVALTLEAIAWQRGEHDANGEYGR